MLRFSEYLFETSDDSDHTELSGIKKGNWGPYKVKHEKLRDGETHFHVYHHDGQQVGMARVSAGKKIRKVLDIGIHPDHRKRGIASSLYNHIEKTIGTKLTPSVGQSPDGKALWNKRKSQNTNT